MSSWNPMDHFRNRCNEMCNSIWKYMDTLSEHIDSLPEGDNKNYLVDYKSTLGFIAELYFFNAVSLGSIRGLEEGVVKALYKKVFGDRSIQLPFEPVKDETLEELVKKYKEKEPSINWIDKDLKNKAKDLEK